MNPEMPYLAAGAIALGTGVARDGGFPDEGMNAIMGTIALMIVASATANTRIAPLVRAIGLLLLMAAVIGAVNTLNRKAKKNG